MELSSSWTLVLFTLCSVALFFGALLGFGVGFYTGGRRERVRQAKERLKRNQSAIYYWIRERNGYSERLKQLKKDLDRSEAWSVRYNLLLEDLHAYEVKLHDCERIISSLSDESLNPFGINLFTLLVQMKEDPVHADLTNEEWNELLHLTDFLFNDIISDWKDQYGLTRLEQRICCLVKWNFTHREQHELFKGTSTALTKSKYRLKKKLELDKDEDLERFIRLH